ncbi:MAG: tripartite tricarboxylate transporter substrate binding protein [Rhizobiaceae bacterium]|nr:tripartite tricarboxylate transporter substrate binding protein [Rhizobiaceae bacterium]
MFRKSLLVAVGAAIVVGLSSPVFAQWTPEEPVKIIVPFGAGGSTDTFGRVFASAMEEATGWTVIVENRPGASGVIGQMEVANAEPDGYTVGLSSTSLFSIQPFLPGSTGELQPDSVDFIGTLSVIPYAIVAAADAPFDNLAELVEYTKENGPAKFSATSEQLTLALDQIAEEIGLNFVAAQTSGSGESLQLVAGRHADITISGGVHVAYVLDGRMKVLAHMLDDRADYAPDAMTVEEQGATLPLRNYFLFNVPKNMDTEVKAALADAIDKTINTDPVKDHAKRIHVKLDNLGLEGSSADVAAQAETWRKALSK